MGKPADDRDVRKLITPPAGVKEQLAPLDDFDENTPVDSDPIRQLDMRSRQAARNAREAASSSRAAFARIGDIQREVRTYYERDQVDHGRLFSSYDRLDEKLESTNKKVDHTNAIVSDLRVNMGTVGEQLSMLVSSIEEERKARIEEAKSRMLAQIEVEKTEKISVIEVKKLEQLAGIDENKATADFNRQKKLKQIGYVGTILGIITTIITAVTQC